MYLLKEYPAVFRLNPIFPNHPAQLAIVGLSWGMHRVKTDSYKFTASFPSWCCILNMTPYNIFVSTRSLPVIVYMLAIQEYTFAQCNYIQHGCYKNFSINIVSNS